MSHVASSRTGAEVRQDLLDLAALWRDQIARHWKLFLAIGIVLELAGFFSIFAPIITSISVAIFVGWALLIGGVIQFAHVLRREAGWERAWRLLVALITALAGLSILLFPLTGTISLTVVLVVWLFVSGVMQLGAWWQERHVEGSWTLGLAGLASVILGALIWADLPSSAAWAIGLLVGIEFILYGMSLIMSAIAGRSLAQNTR
jgi:uncharacterized membrane protein HdeD (DUF308 family)